MHWLMMVAALAADGPDALTAMAVGTASYASVAVAHEVVGHGLGCVAAGGRATGFSTTFMVCDTEGLTPGGVRLGTFSGTGANLLVGTTMASTLAFNRPADGWSQHFLWSASSLHLFLGGSYMMTGALFDTGDFGEYISTVEPSRQDGTRLGIAAAGLGVVGLTFPVSILLADPLMGADPDQRGARKRVLGWGPYAGVGLGVMTLAGALNKETGPAEGSVASLVGYGLGALYFAYMPLMIGNKPASTTKSTPELARDGRWVAVGAASLITVAALGFGIGNLDIEHLDNWRGGG